MSRSSSLFVLLLFVFVFFLLAKVSEESKRTVSIPDELDDVVDDEEDEEWRRWGEKRRGPQRSSSEPPPDFSRMRPSEIQAELMRSHTGPSYGFVKLRLGVSRSRVRMAINDAYRELIRFLGILSTFRVNGAKM